MQKTIQVASRTSQLALIMTNQVIDHLRHNNPDIHFNIQGIKTSNTNIHNDPLGIKGVFTNALDAAVRSGEALFAVHSTKDLPSSLSDDMMVAAFLTRGNPKDALISKHKKKLIDLPLNGVIGTSSPRREMLIKHIRPDLSIEPLRGNIDSRLRKSADYDAIILAASGLERFGATAHITETLDPTVFIPAAGQGVIAVTCKKNDPETIALLSHLDDPETRTCVEIERMICARLNLSCYAPIGVYTYHKDNLLNTAIHLIRHGKPFIASYQHAEPNTDELIENIVTTVLKDTA